MPMKHTKVELVYFNLIELKRVLRQTN